MNAPRSGFRHLKFAYIGLLANSMVYAWSEPHTAYQDKLMVPPYVTEVRQIILTGIARHDWRVLEDKPGQITTELRNEHDQALLVVNTFYGADFIRLQLVSATPLSCPKKSPCAVENALVERWLIGLRHEFALPLLNAAIVDAGGTVIREDARIARFRSPEQSLVAPGATELAKVAQGLSRGIVNGEHYSDLAAERLLLLIEANPTEEQQKEYDDAIEWLGVALSNSGNGRYRDVLAAVSGKLKVESLRRKYSKFAAGMAHSEAVQYRAGSVTLPVFIDNYVEGLQSSDPLFVENVATLMLEAGEKRPELFEMSAKRIELDRHNSNPNVASASAHLCRFLITSNDPRYADLYRSIVELSVNNSLRRWAKNGLIQLGQWK